MASQPTQTEEQTRLWEEVLATLKGRLDSEQAFDTWFRPIEPLHVTPEAVELEVPNSFFVDWIHEHYLATLRLSLGEVLGASPAVQLTAREGHPARSGSRPIALATAPIQAASAAAPTTSRADRAWFESQLNPRHTFTSFVVGSSNAFTHAACRAVAERPGRAYNPLFMFAGSGLGKTHLLHAVGHAVKEARAEARVCYVPAERFTNEMIYAIQHAQTLAFRNKYRNVDLLLIDDIQFLEHKERIHARGVLLHLQRLA